MEVINHKGKHYLKTETGYREILASTDKSLLIESKCWCMKPESGGCYQCNKQLPQIPQSFIEYFISEYNKGNIINEVMVEYEEEYWIDKTYFTPIICKTFESTKLHENRKFEYVPLKLKINPKDNTITIRKVKDSWTREEVIQLLTKIVKEEPSDLGVVLYWNWHKKWIEENLK